MVKTCACGGRYERTDIVAVWSPRFNRKLWKDTDPLVAHWKCNHCGDKRTQRKRLSKEKQAKLKMAANKANRELKFFYEGNGNVYRWWRNDNPGDMFDIITVEELNERIQGAKMCKIPVVSHLPGFCDLGDNCPDHLGYH